MNHSIQQRRFQTLNRDALEERIDGLRTLIDERDRHYTERWESSQKALADRDTATDKRFDTVNEFRGQLGDLIRTFIPRAEADARFQANEEARNALVTGNEAKLDAIRKD